MKKQLYFLIVIFLMSTYTSWAQTECSDVSLEDFVDLKFDLNYETGVFNWTGSPIEDPPIPYSSYNYNFTISIDSAAVGDKGGSGNNPQESTTFTAFEGSVDVGVLCVDDVLTCEECEDAPMQIFVDVTFTLGDCTFTGQASVGIDHNACVNNSTGDDRQVGNTIEELSDGQVSALNADGTVIAFSSAGGYYVYELIGEVWTPIGGEITTEADVEEIFISTDGNSVFVNLSGEFTPQCSYRSGDSFDTNTLSDPISLSQVTRIWDVTADGSYILFQTELSEDGDVTIRSACGTLQSGRNN